MSDGPLRQVLTAFEDGATSLSQVRETTGLDQTVVDAAVDHLVRLGRLDAKELAMGCPGGGCTSCASGSAEGLPGCGAKAPGKDRTGPALVTLQLRRRPDET